MRRILLAAPFWIAACNGEAAEETCDDMCRNLVQDCEYGAFPTLESCTQGCLYNQEQGADVVAEWECIEAAECSSFIIVECEHLYAP